MNGPVLKGSFQMKESKKNLEFYKELNISEEDIYEAMKEISGYLDITPEDFKEIYKRAFYHAIERLATSFKAKDVMTKRVISVRKGTPLQEVAKVMADNRISGVPVVDEENNVVGVISEKDFLRRMGVDDMGTFMGVVAECLKGKGCVAVSIRAKKSEDIMSAPPITVTEDTAVIEIARLFGERNINRVPVIDEKGHLIGIVSRGDIVSIPLLNV